MPEFALDIVIKDITDLVPQPQEGWDYDETDGTFSKPAPVLPVPTLQDAQQAKVTELTNAYDQALATGFTSEANGTSLTYGYTSIDQIKWMKLYIGKANGVLPASQPVATADGTLITLTQTQLQQLLVDMETFEQVQEATFHTLLAQNSAATTVDEVNVIHW